MVVARLRTRGKEGPRRDERASASNDCVLCCGAVVGCSANGANTVSPSERVPLRPQRQRRRRVPLAQHLAAHAIVLVEKSRVDIADLVAPLTAVVDRLSLRAHPATR